MAQFDPKNDVSQINWKAVSKIMGIF